MNSNNISSTINTRNINSLDWWNKSWNLIILNESIDFDTVAFKIPNFIVHSPDMDIQTTFLNSQNIKWKLAIRSDSKFEDNEEDSWAGVFDTKLNVNNELVSMNNAIDQIQNDAISKVWEKISIMIQEMVDQPEYAWTIFWIDSRNWDKGNYTINYCEWLWTNVVDWNSETHVKIVSKNFESFSSNTKEAIFIWNLIEAVKVIDNEFWTDLLDIEYAYKNGIVYILQVRSLTALDEGCEHVKDKFTTRVMDILSKKIEEENLIFWDMIDINPAELLNDTRSKLINTLFADIFPCWPLIKARADLWYTVPDNEIYSILLNKFYINLKENVLSFLPNTLTIVEQNIFIDYYQELILNDPSLQDKLDSVKYPNSLDIVNEILEKKDIKWCLKNDIKEKFSDLFIDLNDKFWALSKWYMNKEKEIISKIFGNENWKIDSINTWTLHVYSDLELLEEVKWLTYLFTLYARWAFYYRNEDVDNEVMHHYNYYKYSNLLIWNNNNFILPKGFDILDLIEVEYHGEKVEKEECDDYIPNRREIFELARDNIKFLFMLLLWELWDRINNKSKDLWIDLWGFYNLSIDELLKNFSQIDRIWFLVSKRTKSKDRLKQISYPSVLSNENLPWYHDLLTSWTYIWEWKVCWDIEYISDTKSLYDSKVLKLLKNKILFLDTATPEIDWILYDLLHNVTAIVTKYWWPWAHIVLRLREENKKRKENNLDAIWLIAWLWDSFDLLKDHNDVTIDFNTWKIC
jgi:hypothetical protein